MEPGRLRGKSSDWKIHPAIPASHFRLRRGNKRLFFRLPAVLGVNQGFIGRPTTPDVGAIAIVPSPHRKHPPVQIVRKLREADKLLGDRADVASEEKIYGTEANSNANSTGPSSSSRRFRWRGWTHLNRVSSWSATMRDDLTTAGQRYRQPKKGNNAKRTPIVIGSFRPHGVPTDPPRWPGCCGDPPP
jgi:hypothetical protein